MEKPLEDNESLKHDMKSAYENSKWNRVEVSKNNTAHDQVWQNTKPYGQMAVDLQDTHWIQEYSWHSS